MLPPRHFRNVALIGLMGAGKSAVGRILADRLQFEIVDTDTLIERQAGLSVSAIFEQLGEPHFRELERELVATLAGRDRAVIATGGGLGADPEHLASLKTHALVCYLCAAPEKLFERVRYASHRPLLKHPDPLGRLRELLAAREPVYRQADLLVSTDWRQPLETALQIAAEFRSLVARQSASA
jgi:shikimate kinase